MARHALQRLESPARSISALIHILGIASFQATFSFGDKYINLPLQTDFGGKSKFLTMIGLALAETTFVFGLLADLSLSPSLFHVKNLLAIGSTPINLLVSILFWGLCAVDKNLVVPPGLGIEIPLVVDLGLHAMPAIMLSIDVLLLSPPWTIQAYGASVLSLALAALYWVWTEICFSRNGWYPYPIFSMLNVWQRMLLFATGSLVMTGCIVSLKWLYGQLNGTQLNGILEFEGETKKPLKE